MGRSVPTNEYEGEKRKFKVWTEPPEISVTADDWDKHLTGETGLGLSPVRKDGACFWAAFDVDNYSVGIEELSKKYNTLPLFFCRTKSGGLHVYMFFEKSVPAKKLIEQMQELAKLLRFPPSFDKNGTAKEIEIFPKQAITEEGRGNWINLPYFGGNNTDRYCVYNGLRLSYDQFVDRIEKNRIKNLKKDVLEKFLFYDAPPCIQTMLSYGITDGMRNIFLINAGVFLKKKFKDTWREKMAELNTHEYIEPVGDTDFKNQLKEIGKDSSLFYQCSTNMKPYCKKDVCRKRSFGIMTDNSPEKAIEGFKKVVVDNSEKEVLYWIVTVYGKPIKMQTEDFIEQRRFKKLVIEYCNELIPSVHGYVWEEIIQDRLKECTIEEVPEDSARDTPIVSVVKSFFNNTEHVEGDLTAFDRKKPVLLDGLFYFRFEHLYSFVELAMKRRGEKVSSESLIYTLDKLGMKNKRKTFNGHQLRVWFTEPFEKIEKKQIPDWKNYEDKIEGEEVF